MSEFLYEYATWFILAGAAVAVFAAVRLAVCFKRFHAQTLRIKNEYNHSYDKDDCYFWQRELRCHYLRLLPFVTKRNVLKVHDVFFRKKNK